MGIEGAERWVHCLGELWWRRPLAATAAVPSQPFALTMDSESQIDSETDALTHSTSIDYMSTRPVSFIRSARRGSKDYKPSIRKRASLWNSQALSFVISSSFLIMAVSWAIFASIPMLVGSFWRKRETFEWDDHKKYRNEKNTKDVRYYARQAGFDIVDEEVKTDDGFLLRCVCWDIRWSISVWRWWYRVHRVVNPRKSHKGLLRLCSTVWKINQVYCLW